MTASFNLVTDRWIPCTDLEGRSVELGIRETLINAHQLRALSCDSPLTTIAIFRLLLAVLHAALGPEDEEVWLAYWKEGAWNGSAVDHYLQAWVERFDLLHPDPVKRFFQAVPQEEFGPKAIIHLVHSQGNTPTLFTHETDAAAAGLTLADAARALVTACSCQLGGLIGAGVSAPSSPSARGVNFLALGRNLFETLALNWFPYPDPAVFPTQPGDRPAWELDDPFSAGRQFTRVKGKDEVVPLGYLDYLTWQNHRIWLGDPDDDGLIREFYMGVGNPKLHESVMNPMYHYRKTTAGLAFLRSSEDRVLWRDSTALLQYRDRDNYRPPYCVTWLARLLDLTDAVPGHEGFFAAGMANNQAKVYFYQEEYLPLRPEYLKDDNLLADLDIALHKTEEVARKVRGAVSRLAEIILSPLADQPGGRKPDPGDVSALVRHWSVMREYWGGLEPHFWELSYSLPVDPDAALDWWVEVLKRAAWQTFEQAEALAGIDAEALKAVAAGRRQLAAGLAKVFMNAEEA